MKQQKLVQRMETESEREHLGTNLGMVILHKESRWSKTKRRFKSWFRREKQVKQQTTALPKIVVTSPEENLGKVIKDTIT